LSGSVDAYLHRRTAAFLCKEKEIHQRNTIKAGMQEERKTGKGIRSKQEARKQGRLWYVPMVESRIAECEYMRKAVARLGD
jgi:hypothetical protein